MQLEKKIGKSTFFTRFTCFGSARIVLFEFCKKRVVIRPDILEIDNGLRKVKVYGKMRTAFAAPYELGKLLTGENRDIHGVLQMLVRVCLVEHEGMSSIHSAVQSHASVLEKLNDTCVVSWRVSFLLHYEGAWTLLRYEGTSTFEVRKTHVRNPFCQQTIQILIS